MDRRQFVKASMVSVGMLAGTFAFGCAPTQSSGSKAASNAGDSRASSGGADNVGSHTTSSGSAGGSSPSAQAAETTPSANRTPEVPIIPLNSGFSMPTLGIGTWTLSDAVAEESAYCALANGYRLIDTAQYPCWTCPHSAAAPAPTTSSCGPTRSTCSRGSGAAWRTGTPQTPQRC